MCVYAVLAFMLMSMLMHLCLRCTRVYDVFVLRSILFTRVRFKIKRPYLSLPKLQKDALLLRDGGLEALLLPFFNFSPFLLL